MAFMAKSTAEAVSLQQLRALAAIAETGSFTLAAESLQLTQPAVSHLVRRMEEELGQPLVVRGRRIRMTEAGQLMLDTAVRALRLIDESVHACRSQAELREGRVVLAVGQLTAGALMPPLLERFARLHPRLAVSLLDSTADQMISRLLTQEADLGFGFDIGPAHSELATEPLFTERLALFVHARHPLAQRATVEVRQLGAYPLIRVNPSANIWAVVNRQIAALESGTGVMHHVSMLSTAFGLVQAGAGVALLPRYVESLMPPDLRMLPVVQPVLEHTVVALRRAKQPLSPAAKAFLDLARRHLRPPRAGRG